MSITIHWGSGSPFAWATLLALEVKELDYDSRLLQLSQGEHKTPEFLALNPRGKVPVLVDGDKVISESLAILVWLDSQYPGPSLFGHGPDERTAIMQALSELISYVETPLITIARSVFFQPWGEASQGTITETVAAVEPELRRLDALLGGQDWLAGDSLSAADLRAYPLLQLLWRATLLADRKGGLEAMHRLDRAGFPGLDRWCARVEALPGYERTYPPHWRG
ncbi:MAG: glutathione S-transferase family protein [Perlucidibaca sp.]